jgi:DegV family protein with EDD domain
MAKVAVLTDSTAYIPSDLVKKHNIIVIPQVLIWENETFRDGIDIQPEQFYERLKKANSMPSTSQALPNDFVDHFNQLLDQGHEVLAVLISEKLSGTMSSAIQAKEAMPGKPIEVIDSKTTAMAMGYLVLQAARAAEAGASLQECKALVEKNIPNTGVLVTVDTLEFLHRGGRIGGGARFLGTALNIKPILEVLDGRLEAVERVRTRSKALARMIDLVEERIAGRSPVRIASLHASSLEDAQAVLDKLSSRIDVVEKLVADVSPVVGTHVGPGTVGITFMAGE